MISLNNKKYCFDIDGTLCTNTYGDYGLAKPYPARIEVVKKLIALGHIVFFYTARGSETGLDWSHLTRSQLVEWGIDDPIIFFGKPSADIYIDDKAINSEIFEWSITIN